jgi:hypothetical protein
MENNWTIEIVNLIPSGFVVGFSIYPRNDEYDENEVIIFLLLISIHFKW